MMCIFCEPYMREDIRFSNKFSKKNVTILIKNNHCYTVFKRFAGKDKLPEVAKQAGTAAANKIIPNHSANLDGTPSKSSTEFLRETSVSKNSVETQETSNEVIDDVTKSKLPNSTLEFNSTRKKVEDASLTPDSSISKWHPLLMEKKDEEVAENDETNSSEESSAKEFPYAPAYLNDTLYVVTIEGKVANVIEDSDHLYVAVKGENDTLSVLGMSTSCKGGTATGEVRNVKLSAVKHNGTFTPLARKEKTGMTDNNEILPKKTYASPINDDYGNLVSYPAC